MAARKKQQRVSWLLIDAEIMAACIEYPLPHLSDAICLHDARLCEAHVQCGRLYGAVLKVQAAFQNLTPAALPELQVSAQDIDGSGQTSCYFPCPLHCSTPVVQPLACSEQKHL